MRPPTRCFPHRRPRTRPGTGDPPDGKQSDSRWSICADVALSWVYPAESTVRWSRRSPPRTWPVAPIQVLFMPERASSPESLELGRCHRITEPSRPSSRTWRDARSRRLLFPTGRGCAHFVPGVRRRFEQDYAALESLKENGSISRHSGRSAPAPAPDDAHDIRSLPADGGRHELQAARA